MVEQVEMTPLGYVIIQWEDDEGKQQKVRWRRPKLREYRELRNHLQELGRETQDLRDELSDLIRPWNDHELAIAQLQPGEPRPTPPPDPDFERVDQLREEIADIMVPWVKRASSMLQAEGELPEDEGEWPAWLASATLPSEIVGHWRKVPKAPGAKGQNAN